MSIHPSLDFIENDALWLPWEEFSDPQLDEEAAALAYSGLFTEHLAALGQGRVRVGLVRQQAINTLDAASPTRRDVVIYVGERAAAVASTLIAPAVIECHPWLNELGGRAIGETLESRLGAVRTDVRYQQLAPLEGRSAANLANNFKPDENRFWARRYRYRFKGGELSITEIIAGSIIADIYRQHSQQHPKRQ